MGVKTFSRANPSGKQIEIYQDFSGGINTELADSATKDNQFRKLVNFDMDKAGSIAKRPGLYRIPYVQKIIKQRLLDAHKEGLIETLIDLKLKNCVEFYDGAHWVFNYVTNKGLVVLILNKNLTLPDDLEPNEYCLFFESVGSTSLLTDKNVLGNRVKISKYNDIYIMYSTLYTQANIATSKKKKQVQLFSWNPVNSDTKENNIVIKKIRPNWIQATYNADDLLEYTEVSESTNSIIVSNTLDFISDYFPNSNIKITPGTLISDYFKDPSVLSFDIRYGFTGNGAYLETNLNNAGWKRHLIIDKEGKQVSDEDVFGIIPHTFSNLISGYNNWTTDSLNIYLNPRGTSKSNGLINFNYKTLVFSEYISKVNAGKALTILSSNADSTFNQDKYNKSITQNMRYLDWTFQKYYYPSSAKTRAERIHPTDMGMLQIDICEHSTNSGIWNGYKWKADLNPDTEVSYKGSLEFNPFVQYEFLAKAFKVRMQNNPIRVRTSITHDTLYTGKDDFYVNLWFWDEIYFGYGIAFARFFTGDSVFNTNLITQEWFSTQSYVASPTVSSLKRRKILDGAVGALEEFTYTYALQIVDNALNNIKYKDGKFGISSGRYSVLINGNLYDISTAIYDKDDFTFEKLTLSNIGKYLPLIDVDNLSTGVDKYGYDFFSQSQLDEFQLALNTLQVGKLFNGVIKFSYVDLSNVTQYLSYNLPPYQVEGFLLAVLNKTTPCVRLQGLKINNELKNVKFLYRDLVQPISQWVEIVEINNNTIPGYDLNPNFFLSTFKMNFIYSTLEGTSDSRVLNFKQLVYVKPNLNDLGYLWYNFNLFSKYTPSTFPDIYNPKIHPNISYDLVEYPKVDLSLYSNSRKIAVQGFVPVNNLILAPGKQLFQVFYATTTDNQGKPATDNLLTAITQMTIQDYNAMINSPDYSTTGYRKNDADVEEKVSGPEWVAFNDLFKAGNLDDDRDATTGTFKPKRATIELDIPTTTDPYLILIQFAEPSDAASTSSSPIKLATVIETRIEMQPNQSLQTKLSITSLFDEFTTTTNLVPYGSSLITYGSTNKLFFSDTSSPGYYPLSRIFQIESPEAIKSCKVFQNKLIISTENSRFYIGGSSFDSSIDPYYIRNISSDSGILAEKSDVPMGNFLYFLDGSGIKVLKNLYGTADKEFAYESLDAIIKSQVPRDKDACGVAFRGKYYLCFPNFKYMLIYNYTYQAWVSYESDYLNFSKMFVDDDILYGIDRDDFSIFRFDDDTFVDNWNEIEDGYEDYINEDGVTQMTQKGTPINCQMQTKQLDQNFAPHQKKYDWAILNATIDNDDDNTAVTSSVIPYVIVDDDLINYEFTMYKNSNNEYNYRETNPQGIVLRDGSVLDNTSILNENRLGSNDNNYYNIPIKRTGGSIAFGFEFNSPSKLTINSLSIQFGLRKLKKNRRGIS